MYQGTTPALTFEIEGFNAVGMTPFVSFKRGNEVLTKTGASVVIAWDEENEKSVIVCQLTQEETLAMKQGSADVQMRFIDSNNQAYATTEASIDVDRVIYKEIIRYGG